MSRIILTFTQNARFYSWLLKNRESCIRATRMDPMVHFRKPIAQYDLGPLPYNHVDLPNATQFWVNNNCPYGFVIQPAENPHPLWVRLRHRFAKKL